MSALQTTTSEGSSIETSTVGVTLETTSGAATLETTSGAATLETTSEPYMETTSAVVVRNAFGHIRLINETWTPALANKTSTEYSSLKTKVQTEVCVLSSLHGNVVFKV